MGREGDGEVPLYPCGSDKHTFEFVATGHAEWIDSQR